MSVVAVIPARYGSTRFPGKPLADATGWPLIRHVYERARRASRVDEVIVATDDERIAAAVRGFGGRAEMTPSDLASGTDRVAAVVRALRAGDADDLVLNVQGDEPELEPDYLDRLVERLAGCGCGMATLACPFPPDADPRDPARVKVVLNRRGEALYFSRSVIPYVRDAGGAAAAAARPLLHLGVYAYRRAFLLEFAGWRPTDLERAEQLEQLRALEHGCAVAVEVVERAVAGIDTPADYDAFVRRWRAAR